MKERKILVLGAGGQIGTDLVCTLREKWGAENVIASDLKSTCPDKLEGGPYVSLNATDREGLRELAVQENVGEVYHLVAMLSASAEQNPEKGWALNMDTLFNVLELGREGVFDKIFWPSSIAVFGPKSPQKDTPQHTILEPTTVYGISKVAGESWCDYYHTKYGVDVRCIRYPGLISHKAAPGGGTTDYAVHIYHEALKNGQYTSFIQRDRYIPMMYMPDAIRATVEIMEAPSEKIKVRTGYNIAAMSFNPEEIGASVREHIPSFELAYDPDYRNDIAADWPGSIDDSAAKADWGWQAEYDLGRMTADMLANLRTAVLG